MVRSSGLAACALAGALAISLSSCKGNKKPTVEPEPESKVVADLPDPTAGGGSLHGSWIELYTFLLDRYESDADLPADDVAARESLCPEGACAKAGEIWPIRFDDGVVAAQFAGLERPDGSIVLSTALAEGLVGEECGGASAQIEIVEQGEGVIADMFSSLGVRGLVCTPGEDGGCTSNADCDADPELAGCGEGCRTSAAHCFLPLDPQTLAPGDSDGECSAYDRLTTAPGDELEENAEDGASGGSAAGQD